MMRTFVTRTEAAAAIGARPCAPMHGFTWLGKQRLDVPPISGTTNATDRLPGAPT